MMMASVLIFLKLLICVTGSEFPVVAVISGSMEPGFQRGDILFTRLGRDPIRVGEIVMFKIDGQEIPIVHRVIKVHEKNGGAVDILTKGDNNQLDDRFLYPPGQLWIQHRHIIGRIVGYLPHAGWLKIILTEKAIKMYLVIGGLVFWSIIS